MQHCNFDWTDTNIVNPRCSSGAEPLVVLAVRDLEANEQIFAEYGPASNSDLLYNFGFVPEGTNPNRAFLLTKMQLRTAVHSCFEAERPKKRQRSPEEEARIPRARGAIQAACTRTRARICARACARASTCRMHAGEAGPARGTGAAGLRQEDRW